jgi:ribosomal protein S18 acetylase RimI-like enzyme
MPERADAVFVTHASWALQRTPGMMAFVRPELVITDSGLPCDTFNFVCRARLEGIDARATMLQVVMYFAGVGRPFSWWIGPADTPRDLGRILGELGLAPAESELAMALPLDDASVPATPVPGLEVRRVRTAAELDAFARLSAANWDPPDTNVLAFYQRTAAALLSAEAPQWLYLGYLDGQPVATAEATVQEGAVGLFNISTRPEFRGRGIGSMLTWQPLRDARSAGCDLGVLQAAEAGVGMYRRLGFASFGPITEYKPGGPRRGT